MWATHVKASIALHTRAGPGRIDSAVGSGRPRRRGRRKRRRRRERRGGRARRVETRIMIVPGVAVGPAGAAAWGEGVSERGGPVVREEVGGIHITKGSVRKEVGVDEEMGVHWGLKKLEGGLKRPDGEKAPDSYEWDRVQSESGRARSI